MKTSINYACQHCNQVATGEYEGFLSGTTILVCDRCDKETYVHLDSPVDYEAKQRVRQAIDSDNKGSRQAPLKRK